MNKIRLLIYILPIYTIMLLLFVSLVSASQTFYAKDTKYRGAFYGVEGNFPCDNYNCWVHDCTWFSSRINVAQAGYYTVRIKLIRNGNEQANENIRLEINNKLDYQLDDGSYESYHDFGPFYFYKGYNEIKFSSTRYGDFFYKTNKDDCYYGSVHFDEVTLIGCPDADNDGVCDSNDRCTGQNQANLPDDTSCRNWFLNEFGCHDYTNKEYGYIMNEVDCDYLDTACRDYHDTKNICDGYGNIIYGSCNDYENKPIDTICGTSYYEYDCHMGIFLGSDVFRREHKFYCDSFGMCQETAASWELYEDCPENEFCYVGQNYVVSCKNPELENFCPELEEINDTIIKEGDLVLLDINATDLNGDDLIFYYAAPLDSRGKWLTTYKDSGNYTIEVNVSDGHCQDSWTFNLEVLDNKGIDLYCFPNFNISNSAIKIKSVKINDIDIYTDIDEKLSIERGNDLFIKVRFQSLKNISELQVEAYIDIEREYEDINISDKTVWFDVIKDTTYTRDLILNVPDDLDKGDYKLKILFYDKNGVMDTCNYNFKVALPIYSIIIKDIKITPEIVKAGRVIIADIEIKNIGNNTVEDITVEASIPEFNIRDSENIDDLEPRESYIVKDLVLRIPTCIGPGEYFVKAIADYEYEKISKVKLFEVRGGEGCSDITEEDIDILKVMPEAENIQQGGIEVPYTIIITNPSDRRKTFIIYVDGVDTFGSYRLEPSNVLIIPEKKSQVAYLYVKANIGESSGPTPIVITAESDSIKKESVIANIIKIQPDSFWKAFYKYIKSKNWYSILLLFLIIIVFLIVLFFLFKKEQEKK